MSAAPTPSQSKQIRLQKPADWTVWLFFVRMIAEKNDIWKLIDPSFSEKPGNINKPVASEFDDSGKINLQAYEKYKAKQGIYKTRLNVYKKQNEAFKQLMKHIQSTICAEAAIFLADEKAHPYNLLKTLKLRYAPNDQAKKIQIETKYRTLSMSPGNQDVEKWLNEWQQTYVAGKALKVYEMTEKRPIRNFIYNLMNKDEAWTNAHFAVINATVTENSLFNLISKFRNHTRLKTSRKLKHSTHSTFSATNQSSENFSDTRNRGGHRGRGRGDERGGLKTSFMGRPQPLECLCGVVHWWTDCDYLNPSKRPSNWQADPEIAKRVNEALKNSDLKEKIETSLKKRRDLMNKQNSSKPQTSQAAPQTPKSGAFVASQQDNSSNEYYGAFTTAITSSAFSTYSYPLQSSWILNNGSDTHVCNKTMLHRFKKTRDASTGGILAGEAQSNVEAFGEVDITIPGPEGNPWKITLRDVCYIPNFMTNIAATGKFRAKGVYFDDQRMRMHANGRTLGWVRHTHGHDVLEDNTSVYTPQEEEDYSTNQIRNADEKKQMIVESIEASHPKEKENSDSPNIASENFENSSTSLTPGENSEISDFPDILAPVQPPPKSKRKFTSSSPVSRDIRFKGDQSERGFKQPRKQGFHAAFGAHLDTNRNFQNHQNHQNQKTGLTSYWLGHRKKKINHIQVEAISPPPQRDKSAPDWFKRQSWRCKEIWCQWGCIITKKVSYSEIRRDATPLRGCVSR